MSHPGPPPAADPAQVRDLQLVRAIRQGDPAAWSTLLARHQDRLYATCLRMIGQRDLASDLCQESMVRIIQGIGSYDGAAAITTWMTRVAMNVCLTHLRSAKLRTHASLDAPMGTGHGRGDDSRTAQSLGASLATGELSGPQRVQDDEARELVARGLASIEPEQRAILVLRDVRGLDYAQISKVLGIAEGTVKSRLFRARAALRAVLEKSGEHG